MEASPMNRINVYKIGMWLGAASDIIAITAGYVLTLFITSLPPLSANGIYLVFLAVTLAFLNMLDAYDDLSSYTTQKKRLPITLAVAFGFSICTVVIIIIVFPAFRFLPAACCTVFFVLSYALLLLGRMTLLRLLIKMRKCQSLLILYAEGCPEVFINKLKHKAVDYGRVDLCETASDDVENRVISRINAADQLLILGNLPLELRDKYILHGLTHEKAVKVIPTVENLSFLGGRITHIGDTPVIGLKNERLVLLEKVLKRVFDFTAALFGLIVTLPVFAVCAALIKLDSKGPVFYTQERYTIYKRKFNIIKFRTMINGAEDSGAMLATENDSRITRVGKILRACRLDELPQLVNILKGEMSVVGPRPERPVFADRYSKMVKNYDVRYTVKAGLTGYAQIYGQYNTKVSDKVLFDSIYINNFSIWLDIKLMVQTAMIMFIKESTEGVDESLAAVPKEE